MQEQLIEFETAKLAKEKGFELNSCSYYELVKKGQYRWKFIDEEDDLGTWVNEDPKNRIAAPTQSLLQKWLREEHKEHIKVVYMNETNTYNSSLTMRSMGWSNFKTYEEALEKGLQEALKLITK